MNDTPEETEGTEPEVIDAGEKETVDTVILNAEEIYIGEGADLELVEDLILYEGNSRIHSERQISHLIQAFKKYGFLQPVVVDEMGVVLAGHGRLMTAKRLGMKEVPVTRIEGLSAAQKKAYVIADNALGEQSSWDTDILKVELNTLDEEGVDFESIGYRNEELSALLGGSHSFKSGVSDAGTKGKESGGTMTFSSTSMIVFLDDDESYQLTQKYEAYKQHHGNDEGFIESLLPPLDEEKET